MEVSTKLSNEVNHLLLNKLSKDYYESDVHPEYQVRSGRLKENFDHLISLLKDDVFTQKSVSSSLPYILLLHLELKTTGPWNTKENHHKECAEKLNRSFKDKYKIDLIDVLKNDQFASQEIFDACIKELHRKMTGEEFKRYPSLIEVYCLLVNNVKKYKIKLNPVTVVPVALLLIEDYITSNKIKGLKACTSILQCLKIEDFTAGNYYEVVYSSLKKNIVEKDKEVTQALFTCLLEFLKVIPPNIKKLKLDDIYASILDQLHTETNLYRKADCLNFLTKIIDMHGVHCVKRKLFKQVIIDNIDICTNDSVCEILFMPVLDCLQMWIKHCWCIWKLSNDHKMLSALFKMLYITENDDQEQKIQDIISTLIKLCTEEEQTEIAESLQEPFKNEFIVTIKGPFEPYFFTFNFTTLYPYLEWRKIINHIGINIYLFT